MSSPTDNTVNGKQPGTGGGNVQGAFVPGIQIDTLEVGVEVGLIKVQREPASSSIFGPVYALAVRSCKAGDVVVFGGGERLLTSSQKDPKTYDEEKRS